MAKAIRAIQTPQNKVIRPRNDHNHLMFIPSRRSDYHGRAAPKTLSGVLSRRESGAGADALRDAYLDA